MSRAAIPAFAVAMATAAAIASGVAAAGSLPAHAGLYVVQPHTQTPGGPAGEPPALPMQSSKIDVVMHGPIAEVSVAQTFRNDASAPTEATYIFPLPYDAAVTAMAIDTGARTIHAAIERRAQAQSRYEDALAAGLDAGLLEQERPDVFTQTVAAIPPHATVTVRVRFDAMARYHDGTWELVVPLVVAPRYVPGNASGRPTVGSGRAPDTDRSPDASRVTPPAAPGAGGQTELAIAFAAPVDGVASPTHAIAQQAGDPGKSPAGGKWVIVDPASDRDAVIRWRDPAPAVGWTERDGNTGYAAAIVAGPVAPAASAARPAARATFVFDRAATTLGDGQLVEQGVETALVDALGAGDAIATDRGVFLAASALRGELERQRGHKVFDVTRVLEHLHPAGAPVVLVTDGLVSDDAAAIAAARALGVPVHVIGFGPAPNRGLLSAIAGATGGTLRVAVIGDDLPALARDVLADVATPPAPFAVTWGTLAASAIVPALQPRLGVGQTAVVFAKLAHIAPPSATANARAAGVVFELAALTAEPAPPGATTPLGPLARRWARLALDELIVKHDRAAIAQLALAYGLVSPETSLVAIGEEVSVVGGVKHTKAVPVSLPAGMQWQDVKRETTVDARKPAETEHEEAKNDAKNGAKTDTKNQSDAVAKQTYKNPTPTYHAPTNSTPPPAPPRTSANHPAPPPPAQQPQPAPKNEPTPKKHHPVADSDGDDRADKAEAGDDDDAAASDNKKGEVITIQGSAPIIDQGSTKTGVTLSEDYTRNVPVGRTFEATVGATAGESILISSSSGRFDSLALSLGGGLVLDHGTATGMGALALRYDVGRLTRFGVEGALWLAGTDGGAAGGGAGTDGSARGVHLEGLVGLYVARALGDLPLQLQVGPALHLGNGVGPALDLTLRYYPTGRWTAVLGRHRFDLYLREDAALLWSDGGTSTESATSAGLELGF